MYYFQHTSKWFLFKKLSYVPHTKISMTYMWWWITLCILFNTHLNDSYIENYHMYHKPKIFMTYMWWPITLCILFNTHSNDSYIGNCHMYHTKIFMTYMWWPTTLCILFNTHFFYTHKQLKTQTNTHMSTVATPLWPSVGVKPNTWKSWGFGVLRDSRTFKARQQGSKHLALRRFLVSLKRSWNVDIENGLALVIWTFAAQVMGKRRARSQTGSLTPDH
jgi:hypothetical protein